ncbi:hypothetical protein L291_2662 [Acinetobacter guillouiae MSP4-18]|nr:hypothetical protein F981_01054 [Acinetobacter guillouiae CIP 63.46]EPH38562.1 hypothetical protein L291_2662 [Acinetobacter guillouiae MSP4-18]
MPKLNQSVLKLHSVLLNLSALWHQFFEFFDSQCNKKLT